MPMHRPKKVKKIQENLLVEHSIDFMVESHKEITLYETVAEGEEAKELTFLQLTGVFQKGNTPNGNRRIYKTELLAREDEKFQSRIKRGTALGKGYHPGFFDLGGPSGLSDVTHRITKTWMEGDFVHGELIILKTSMGKDEVEPIISGGGKIGISSRGYGGVEYHEKYEIAGKKYKNVFVVDDNYQLETYDLVLTPSVKSAMLKPMKGTDKSESSDEISNKCDESISKGGSNSMTIEELKSLHPELYNKVRDAAVKEGKELGTSDTKTALESEYKVTVEANKSEIGTLKESNKTLVEENAGLKTENADLKDKAAKAEAARLSSDIKVAVTNAVGASTFKGYFKENDITFIVSQCETVEDVVKEVGAREKVYENAIETFKNMKKIDTKSQNMDTSEDNSNGTNEDTKQNEADARNEQRALAFG
jgi:hypothetical protein